jgi:hypothetical protein
MSPTGLRHVALVTCREALALDEDLAPLRDALAALGAEVALPCWDDASIDWARFDIAVLRSTWDYAERNDEFLDWAARCAAATRLVNPLDVVRWNTNKRYLADLARAGVPAVPTRFVAAGAEAAAELERFLAGGEESLSIGRAAAFSDFVVKPVVGAGTRDAARYTRADLARALTHLRRLLAAGRDTMLQPYLDDIDQHGETAMIFFEGKLSHAVCKGPLPGARDRRRAGGARARAQRALDLLRARDGCGGADGGRRAGPLRHLTCKLRGLAPWIPTSKRCRARSSSGRCADCGTASAHTAMHRGTISAGTTRRYGGCCRSGPILCLRYPPGRSSCVVASVTASR